jgi:GR25 family glycosyltransferase involved in LPS biosynthesis
MIRSASVATALALALVLALMLASCIDRLAARKKGRLCVIIHLDARSERLGAVLALKDALTEWSHRCTVLAAVDGTRWPRRRVPAFCDLGAQTPRTREYLRGGEQGCLASHRKAWAMALEEGRASLILEDDVRLLPGARELLAGDALDVALGGRGPALLHLVRVIPRAKRARSPDVAIARACGFVVYRVASANYSLCAYALNAGAATLLLASRHLLPADDLVASTPGLTLLALGPAVVERHDFPSDTEGE